MGVEVAEMTHGMGVEGRGGRGGREREEMEEREEAREKDGEGVAREEDTKREASLSIVAREVVEAGLLCSLSHFSSAMIRGDLNLDGGRMIATSEETKLCLLSGVCRQLREGDGDPRNVTLPGEVFCDEGEHGETVGWSACCVDVGAVSELCSTSMCDWDRAICEAECSSDETEG